VGAIFGGWYSYADWFGTYFVMCKSTLDILQVNKQYLKDCKHRQDNINIPIVHAGACRITFLYGECTIVVFDPKSKRSNNNSHGKMYRSLVI